MSRHQGVALWGSIVTSIIVLALDFVVSWYALTHEFSQAMHDIVIFIAGNVNAMALACVSYWVGSSSGSMVKTITADGITEVKQGPHP